MQIKCRPTESYPGLGRVGDSAGAKMAYGGGSNLYHTHALSTPQKCVLSTMLNVITPTAHLTSRSTIF